MTDPTARTPKTGYISNGLPVEILAEFDVDGETKYYVREFYDGETSDFYNPDDAEPWGAEYVVSHIYDKVETTPTGLRHSRLQAEVEALEAKRRAEAEQARQAALDEKRDPGFTAARLRRHESSPSPSPRSLGTTPTRSKAGTNTRSTRSMAAPTARTPPPSTSSAPRRTP